MNSILECSLALKNRRLTSMDVLEIWHNEHLVIREVAQLNLKFFQ
jgi:hypothetical protein